MTASRTLTLLALLALGCANASGIFVRQAHAAPPTVQYSPGYDARLAEARKAARLAAQQRLGVMPARRRYHHRHP